MTLSLLSELSYLTGERMLSMALFSKAPRLKAYSGELGDL